MSNMDYYKEGDVIIGVPNEWMPMCVGPIVRFFEKGSRVPVVMDWVAGKEVLCFSPVVRYNIENLRALCKLNPFERYSLVSGFNPIYQKEKAQPDYNMTFEEYVEAITTLRDEYGKKEKGST